MSQNIPDPPPSNDVDLKGKRVCCFARSTSDVRWKMARVTDTTRLDPQARRPSHEIFQQGRARRILLAHFGRPKGDLTSMIH